MLMGLAGLVICKWRRKAVLPMLGLVVVGSVSPVWANSVYVSNTSFPPQISGPPPTGTFQCQQSGSASAFCQSDYSAFYGRVTGGGLSAGTAAFGALTGRMQESGGGSGYLTASFGDNVVVTGGSGAGTLVAHYALATTALAYLTDSNKTGGFSFVQGATTANVSPVFLNFGFTSPNLNPPAGCGMFGLCFSEMFDVSSPMTFGAALPMGAATYLMSDGLGELPVDLGNGLNANTSLTLTGFTVLNAAGSVIAGASVTPQNQPWSPTPEPVTWGLMLAGLAILGMRKGFRRSRPLA